MNKKSVLQLHKAYELIQKAGTGSTPQAKEADVFEILKILSENEPNKDGFSFGEIYFINSNSFMFSLNDEQISRILLDAKQQGKVVSNRGCWKLAPEKETNGEKK